MSREFWKSAGLHLVDAGAQGWLSVTADFMRAYYTRPEMHPVADSCAAEIRLFDELMADPFMTVNDSRLTAIADADAAGNYRLVLRFRDLLAAAGTIEGAYLKLVARRDIDLPPLFLDQIVHLILRNILKDVRDPMRLRAAEIFFRGQCVSTDDGRAMLADDEILNMRTRAGGQTGHGKLLDATPAGRLGNEPARTIELDVLSEDNSDIYWSRSDRFDTVVDFSFGRPALDAFARVIEAWLRHMAKLDVNVQPLEHIEDPDWRWHIGLDKESNRILNMLYEGAAPPAQDLERIVALFEMHIDDRCAIVERARDMPVYLGLAMSKDKRIKMKPQNLLMNLPLSTPS